jgi:hypothetical protein
MADEQLETQIKLTAVAGRFRLGYFYVVLR